MEFRNFNLLRQPKYRYDFLPSEIVALADYRAKKNRARLNKAARGWDRIVIAGSLAAAAYFTGHVLWWALK
jgi:hypothetical protein